jgi:hypothetical protein
MQAVATGTRRPELKDIVVEASRALAHLDADRLEELAVSCQALNRDLPAPGNRGCADLLRQASAAGEEMATFARVLEATRSNLRVLHRLREIRMGHSGYGDGQVRGWTDLESAHGNH